MKYRKKPVVIDAMQYGPYTAPTLEMSCFLYGAGASWGPEGITIPTLDGPHLARVGDFIIKGIAGEFYPCKPDIFEATYEQADGPAADRIEELEKELADQVSLRNDQCRRKLEALSRAEAAEAKLEKAVEWFKKLDRRGDTLEFFDPFVHKVVTAALAELEQGPRPSSAEK